jgi:hypothetical protein
VSSLVCDFAVSLFSLSHLCFTLCERLLAKLYVYRLLFSCVFYFKHVTNVFGDADYRKLTSELDIRSMLVHLKEPRVVNVAKGWMFFHH